MWTLAQTLLAIETFPQVGNESPRWHFGKHHLSVTQTHANLNPGSGFIISYHLKPYYLRLSKMSQDSREPWVRHGATSCKTLTSRALTTCLMFAWHRFARSARPPPPAEPEDRKGSQRRRLEPKDGYKKNSWKWSHFLLVVDVEIDMHDIIRCTWYIMVLNDRKVMLLKYR